MQLKGKGPAVGRQRQVKVLCIDNHASSNYACFLLARSGCKVNSASFLCDALELIHGSSYDVCLVNDELARSGKELFQKLREAAGSTPFILLDCCLPIQPAISGPVWQHPRNSSAHDGSGDCGESHNRPCPSISTARSISERDSS
jgi:hypothetical protein